MLSPIEEWFRACSDRFDLERTLPRDAVPSCVLPWRAAVGFPGSGRAGRDWRLASAAFPARALAVCPSPSELVIESQPMRGRDMMIDPPLQKTCERFTNGGFSWLKGGKICRPSQPRRWVTAAQVVRGQPASDRDGWRLSVGGRRSIGRLGCILGFGRPSVCSVGSHRDAVVQQPRRRLYPMRTGERQVDTVSGHSGSGSDRHASPPRRRFAGRHWAWRAVNISHGPDAACHRAKAL